MKIPTIFVLLLFTFNSFAKDYPLSSPDKNIQATVSVGDQVTINLMVKGKDVLDIKNINLSVDKSLLLAQPKVSKKTSNAISHIIKPQIGINSEIAENYNELTLSFRNDVALILRAYNEGFAYRFSTSKSNEIIVDNETSEFQFSGNYDIVQLGRADDWHGYETSYQFTKLSKSDSIKNKCLPLYVDVSADIKVALLEADLMDYPGMYLTNGENSTSLKAIFPKYPTEVEQRRFNLVVQKTADYIAKTNGTRTFPWRVVAVAENDKDFLNNDIVYMLASESKIEDASWVKPGKVAWDWWNALNMHGVDFETGFNTETYKYFIDFAAANNIQYINLDEGWSNQYDLLDVTDKLDVKEVVDYAKSKNVGVILWCVWHTLDRQMTEALDQFEKWGIVGVKVDFMDRDDQLVVQFYERLLKEAAKRKIVVNYHGAYKPTGLRRAYPNLINREAVKGLEYSKWSKDVSPEHDVTLPFTRMLAGPMDFTPGAMINANKQNFFPVFERPMSQGTRCHQLAMFVTYYAPLQMLADAPTNYEEYPDILEFFQKVPTNWDKALPLDGKIGDYAVIARKSGDTWYVAAMTDWNSREIEIDLGFLEAENYKAMIFEDGINAHRNAIDYKRVDKTVSNGDRLKIKLAPGGGWVGVFGKE